MRLLLGQFESIPLSQIHWEKKTTSWRFFIKNTHTVIQIYGEMKKPFGSPGKASGMILRIGQCLFSAASIGVMTSASGFSTVTAFCYLIASMGLQVLWSFGLACLDMHALRFNKELHNHIIMSLFVVGDWVIATLSLAAACSSAGVMVLFTKDTEMCKAYTKFSCNMFPISIAFAFVSWFLIAISSYVMFWLVAST